MIGGLTVIGETVEIKVLREYLQMGFADDEPEVGRK